MQGDDQQEMLHESQSNNNNNENGGENYTNSEEVVLDREGTSASATVSKNQLQQLDAMREALFSQDGWGCQYVNQDINWHPLEAPTDPIISEAKINNGTELWDINFRNNDRSSSQPAQEMIYGRVTSTNTSSERTVWTKIAPNPVDWTQSAGNVWSTTTTQKKEAWGNSIATADTCVYPPLGNAPDLSAAQKNISNFNQLDLHKLTDDLHDGRCDVPHRPGGTLDLWGQYRAHTSGQVASNEVVGTTAVVAETGETQFLPNPSGFAMDSKATDWKEPSGSPQRSNIPYCNDGTFVWMEQPRKFDVSKNRVGPNAEVKSDINMWGCANPALCTCDEQYAITNILDNMSGGNVNGSPNPTVNYMQNNVSGAQTASGFKKGTVANRNSRQPSIQWLVITFKKLNMAVEKGYLNSEILSQQLAPVTIILINQLLSNIQHLQEAQNHLTRNPMNGFNIIANIVKYKQQIFDLQLQINLQQTLFVQQQQAPLYKDWSNSKHLNGQHNTLGALAENFSEISLNKEGHSEQFRKTSDQQFKLKNRKPEQLWKKVSPDNTNFSTARDINNVDTLGLTSGQTWYAVNNNKFSDSINECNNKDWQTTPLTTSNTPFTALVPEFEPGKPWKGSQFKIKKGDHTIGPSSVTDTPLSFSLMPKDVALFGNSTNTASTDLSPLSLSSSTWSFNPSKKQNFVSNWPNNAAQTRAKTSELRGAYINKFAQGPLSGFGVKNIGASSAEAVTYPSVVSGNSSGLIDAAITRRVPAKNFNWSNNNTGNWQSNWLLLKNLTTQIDGTTLRTLCMQHGLLLNFHIYLNKGIALCEYSSREEANKAQMVLNICVLGDITICAESPTEYEVQNMLRNLLPLEHSGPNADTEGSVTSVRDSSDTSGGQSSWY